MKIANYISKQLHWTWILMITYVVLSFIYPIFGLFGFVCMFTPIILGLTKQGKLHCTHLCPRASFFQTFLAKAKWNRIKTPKFFGDKRVKYFILCIMFARFGMIFFMYYNQPLKLAMSVSGFMTMTMTIGILMGLFFNARSWCQICPMMTLLTVIDKKK